jgi:hypothetical protein
MEGTKPSCILGDERGSNFSGDYLVVIAFVLALAFDCHLKSLPTIDPETRVLET